MVLLRLEKFLNNMKKLNELTIKEAAEKLQNGEVKSVELTKACLDTIKEKNTELNAVINILEKEALSEAQESDRQFAISAKRRSPLDGIPIVLKDNMAMSGTLTTSGSKMLENFRAPYDSTVVKRLKEAGAIIIAKTNMDEFAMGSSTESSHFGPTKNPWDTERVPGGSSGGSAAAVAAQMTIAALGSDTGGSIRQPASFCGIVGFKPTYGTVSRYGLFAMASSLDQIGPMTKTVEDAEILFKVIAGYDEKDSTSLSFKTEFSSLSFRTGSPKAKQDPESINNEERSRNEFGMTTQNSEIKIQNLKLGIPKEYFAEGLDPEVKERIAQGVERFKKMGAEVKEISLPNTKYALSCYYIIMPVEVASNLGRYDGVKYGFRASDAKTLVETYFKTRSEGFGVEVKRRIILGTYTSAAGYIDQYYNQAQKVRALIKQDFDKAFEEVDFILGPVSPTTAFKIGEKTADPLTMYLSDIYTIAINLAGLPALSVPAGLANELPVGLQIIGPQFSDYGVLNLGKIYEGVRGELPKLS